MLNVEGWIHGVRYSFSTDVGSMSQRIETLVGDRERSPEISAEDTASLSVTITSKPTFGDGHRVLGSGLSAHGDTAIYRDRWSAIRIRRTGDRSLEIDASFEDRPDRVVRKRLPGQSHFRDQHYQVIARSTIYLPAQLLLKQCFGLHTAHASSVHFPDTGFGSVIFAMNGVGKSSLALALADSGASLLSDNYVLHDREKFFRFPESLRMASSPPQRLAREVEGFTLNRKRVFTVSPDAVANSSEVLTAVSLSRGKERAVQQISSRRLSRIVLGQSLGLGELLETSWLARACKVLGFESLQVEHRQSDLESALSKSRCFDLQIQHSETGKPDPRDLTLLKTGVM